MTKLRTLLMLSAATLAVPALASAGTVKLQSMTNPARTVKVQLTNDSKNFNSVVYATRFNWVNGQPNQSGIPELAANFTSFCIELTEHVSVPGVYSGLTIKDLANAPSPGSTQAGSASGGMGANKKNLLQKLYGNFYNSIDAQTTAALKSLYAAAFQVTIWEIVYDDGLLLNNGALKVTGNSSVDNSPDADILDLANTWLGQLSNPVSLAAMPSATNLAALSGPNFQDQIVFVNSPDNSVATIPLPSASMAGAGLFALSLLHRRRASV